MSVAVSSHHRGSWAATRRGEVNADIAAHHRRGHPSDRGGVPERTHETQLA
jgi:hypothetical protein